MATVREHGLLKPVSLEDALVRMSGLVESPAELAPPRRPTVVADLYRAFKEEGRRLVDITWDQHRLHEARRWSATALVESVCLEQLTEKDRFVVWSAGKAEMTAKPSADRMARLADKECRRWVGKDSVVASIVQALGTWSRYWNEEEAHHETSFTQLAMLAGFEPLSDDAVIEYRKVFPDDDLLRTVTMLAFSESIASVNYGQYMRQVSDPGLKMLFKHVGADEVQHMQYFISFAKALVDSGAYPAKEAFAVAHFFLREEGELYGSAREHVEDRGTHINWWDHLESEAGQAAAAPEALDRKRSLILHSLRRITGVACASAEEVEDTWMDLVGC
ncbi:ferritin-like domain-containing protein [Stigmatella sp. ncwal1]|uniref:Ferritin-like domain-containing protein n=1 Tax=Stigmatella ashevillensis TaxID=2995309 RepID=A0ABT5D482_9BACT|nr:ferritin-like domain-containing protein [Stigmatella ashevillena]MDC0708479.1 ferritin-like domain-containing protein [Stigmatella ashevillena]